MKNILKVAGLFCGLVFGSSMTQLVAMKNFSPKSSIWSEIAQNEKLSRDEKWNLFIKDCVLNKKFSVPAKSSTSLLRVATYNLHCFVDPYSNKDPNSAAHLAGVIGKLYADVLFLQEFAGLDGCFNRGHNKDFHMGKELKKMDYEFTPVKTWKLYNGFGNQCCWKKTLAVTNAISKIFNVNFAKPNDDEKRGFVGGHFIWNGKKVATYALHLDVWDQTGDTRAQQVKELISFIKEQRKIFPNTTFIIGGDFNAVRAKDYDYFESGKKVWELLKGDDLERKIKTPQSIAELFEKEEEWLGNVYDALPDQAPKFTSCFGKTVDYLYFTKGTGLEPAVIHVDYTTVQSEKIDPKTLKTTGEIYITTPSDHLPVVVDFQASKNVATEAQIKFLVQFKEKLALCKIPLDIGDNKITRLILLDALENDFKNLAQFDQGVYRTEFKEVVRQGLKEN
ncbi:TPA: hypothetical protein DDZ86_01635 [Candidatus Dependentiae bacterium]|nr:MAG: hypothetical protein UW09_C0001G0309 [candidate division TM6 bacterium GW2011_GWF2_43_87]HBL98326.1 hypothetical protein [Candidatus Dependentiae bacterium]